MMIIVFPNDVTPVTIYSARLTSCFGCFHSIKTNVTTLKKTSHLHKNKAKQNKVERISGR